MQFKTLGFRAISASLVWALLVAAVSADDSVTTSQQDRFSIALPNANWKQSEAPNASAKWVAVNPAKGKSIVVLVFDSAPAESSRRAGPEFESGFLKSSHGKEIKAGDFVIDGRTAYRFVAESPVNGKKLTTVGVYLISNGRAYAIEANSFAGDADTDPELNAGINSFHFLDPPEPPKAANGGPMGPHDAAYRMGETVGRWFAIILIAVLVLYGVKKAVGW